MSLSVSNMLESGSAEAKIYVDDVLLQEAESRGGVASVSGVVH